MAIAQMNNLNSCETPPADLVEVQVYVSRLHGIDQKAGTFKMDGYFRLFWNDPRLMFNGTEVR